MAIVIAMATMRAAVVARASPMAAKTTAIAAVGAMLPSCERGVMRVGGAMKGGGAGKQEMVI